jgi:hypothetical protein
MRLKVLAPLRDLLVMVGAVLLLAKLLWWWSGPAPDELVEYSSFCLRGGQILPLGLATRTTTFEENFKRYEENRANCLIVPMRRTTYKLNMARAEVYYMTLGGPERLVDCKIFDRTDWVCSYPDGSGSIVMIDGLRAISADDNDIYFYQRRWQWWLATLWSWVGRPQGAWMIPEQHERF